MKNRKGYTWVQTLAIVLVLVFLLIMLNPIKKAIERVGMKQKGFVMYKGRFVVRVTGDPGCQLHLTIEDPNSEISQGRMVFISACSFQNNPDPNDIKFKVIDIRNVPEGNLLLELATFKGVKEAYQYLRTEQASREKEKADSTKATRTPGQLPKNLVVP